MAGISDYRRSGAPYFYDQGQGDEPRASSSRSANQEFYYGAGNRAISPYSTTGPYSPRLGAAGYTTSGGMDNIEGGRRDKNNFGLSFNNCPSGVSSSPESPEDPTLSTLPAKGVGLLAIVAENLLSHPFLVLRRQCQVHTTSTRYHLFPFTLLPPVFHICQRQGFAVLWKGLGSTLVVRGMALAVEDVTCKVTDWPKEITRHTPLRHLTHHLLLKTLSLSIITPFYSASLVETVQSDVASETAGFFDVFREGFWRLLSWPSTGRLVPLHLLIVPTVAHGILSYLIFTGVKSVSVSTIRRVRERRERGQGALSKDTTLSYYTEMTASLIGNMAADIILFPLETVLNRLHLQGTRTIIDSLENGFEVTPILTSYNGVLDCLRTTIDEEGFGGLYKGFGALVLQYGLQILVIRGVKILLENCSFGGSGGVSEVEKSGGYGYSTPNIIHQSRSEPNNVRRTPTNLITKDLRDGDYMDSGIAEPSYRSRSRFNSPPSSIR